MDFPATCAHDRNSWVHTAMGDCQPLDIQVDTDTVIPFVPALQASDGAKL